LHAQPDPWDRVVSLGISAWNPSPPVVSVMAITSSRASSLRPAAAALVLEETLADARNRIHSAPAAAHTGHRQWVPGVADGPAEDHRGKIDQLAR